jgi:hypothetical protein
VPHAHSGRVIEIRQLAHPDDKRAGRLGRLGRLVTGVVMNRLKPDTDVTLPRLDATFPRVRLASRQQRGVGAVAVSDIVGTASYSPGTRQLDFLPTADHQPADWQGRWSRLEQAGRELTPLPPIELLKAGDGYWVVDGHNRVALAKATGQVWIDADVTELLLPSPSTPIPAYGGIS